MMLSRRIIPASTYALIMLGLIAVPIKPVHSQASGVPVPSARRPPPLQYFFRSFLIPGWGQASLDRKLTGGLMIAFEGVALGMALKAHHEIDYLERTGSGRAEAKREERQDWLVLVVFNHLLSGLEAFVSANLYDFPGDLNARVLPGGRTGFGLSVPLSRP
jgi:hypothetical protein